MIATLKHGGLPEGVRRSGFIEYVAPALKARGISTSAISYLSKALENWTRDQDFTPNRVCGFWHKVGCLAEKLSVTVRTINSIERQLEGAGLIQRTIMANGARGGCREEGSGSPLRWLLGINLAPLVELAPALISEVETIRMKREAIALCQMEIRQINKRIRQLRNEDALEQARMILPNGRTATIQDMAQLEAVRSALQTVEKAIVTPSGSAKSSDQSEENSRPIIQTQESKFLYAPDCAPNEITIRQVMDVATEEFCETVAMYGDYSWRGIVEAAYQIGLTIGINERAWQAACASLGRERAALCVILIHRNQDLPIGHPYQARIPVACLRGMARSALAGSLNLVGFIGAARGQSARQNLQFKEKCCAL